MTPYAIPTLADVSPRCTGAVRIQPVLAHYRSFAPAIVTDTSRRFQRWLTAIVDHPAVKATTSTDELYKDSYHRYAQNLPMTSQVREFA